MRHSASMCYNKMLPSPGCHPSFTVSTNCNSWLFHILVPCPSSSITLISLIPSCIGSVRNYRNPIQCAYHSVISLLLSGSLWSHLWNKSRTKLYETSDKLAIFACNDSFQSKLKRVTTQSNNSLVMMYCITKSFLQLRTLCKKLMEVEFVLYIIIRVTSQELFWL